MKCPSTQSFSVSAVPPQSPHISTTLPLQSHAPSGTPNSLGAPHPHSCITPFPPQTPHSSISANPPSSPLQSYCKTS